MLPGRIAGTLLRLLMLVDALQLQHNPCAALMLIIWSLGEVGISRQLQTCIKDAMLCC
jgi:hypothetical protein